MTAQDVESRLATQGWAIVDLPDPAPVFAVRDRLLDWLRQKHPALVSLERYHELDLPEEQHVQTLYDLSLFYWESDLGRSVIDANLPLLRALIGPDLHVQRYPYLRAVRPGRHADAAPIHRDVYYGASPYEVSVLIPFTEMGRTSGMRVVSGSHLAPDGEYPFTQTVSQDVVIQSPKHKLGYAYAPRLLDPALMDRSEVVPLKVGQVVMFPLSLVHGGGIDTSSGTRFSTDIRVVNSWAPVAFSRGVHQDYFVPLCSSAVTRVARRYLESNLAAEEKP